MNSIDASGWSEIFRFKTMDVAGVAIDNERPVSYKMYQNYPNPFNATTTISFDIAKEGRVVLKLYDAIGREVATILDQFLEQGHHKVLLNSSDLATGVYFSRLIVENKIFTKKMILLK